MPTPVKKPRIGAHTPTTGGMAKRSIAYAEEIGAEAIQVFASSPRTWAMPEAKPDLDEAFKIKAAELDIETYVHAPFLINLGSPTEATYLNSLASTNRPPAAEVASTRTSAPSVPAGRMIGIATPVLVSL